MLAELMASAIKLMVKAAIYQLEVADFESKVVAKFSLVVVK